jgi:hypothetical protein
MGREVCGGAFRSATRVAADVRLAVIVSDSNVYPVDKRYSVSRVEQ